MTTEHAIHLAIIPDGNRRWAKAKNLNPWKGHEQAIENFRKITEWCQKDPRVNVLTVWCFSTENWKRDKKEIDNLMTMLERYLEKEWKGFIKNHTRFCHSGRRDRLPASLVNLIEKVEKETEKETDFTLNLAVDYGGKDEVLRAMKKMENNISEDELKKHLDHPELPDMDLIIRTSGESRTSNFALWKSAYAEWEFNEKLFPDFSIDDLAQAIEKFAERSRRFGS